MSAPQLQHKQARQTWKKGVYFAYFKIFLRRRNILAEITGQFPYRSCIGNVHSMYRVDVLYKSCYRSMRASAAA